MSCLCTTLCITVRLPHISKLILFNYHILFNPHSVITNHKPCLLHPTNSHNVIMAPTKKPPPPWSHNTRSTRRNEQLLRTEEDVPTDPPPTTWALCKGAVAAMANTNKANVPTDPQAAVRTEVMLHPRLCEPIPHTKRDRGAKVLLHCQKMRWLLLMRRYVVWIIVIFPQ